MIWQRSKAYFKNQPYLKRHLPIAVAGLFVILLVARMRWCQEFNYAANVPRAHLLVPSGNVSVPFSLVKGWIILQASSGNTSARVLFDTGSPECWWNGTVPFSSYSFSCDRPWGCMANQPVGKWRVIRSVHIGGLVIKDLPFISMPIESRPVWPLFGANLFSATPISINYAHRKLIFYNPKYDIRVADPLGQHTTRLLWQDKGWPGTGTKSLVRGLLAGIPVTCLIDTGSAEGWGVVVENPVIAERLRRLATYSHLGRKHKYVMPFQIAGNSLFVSVRTSSRPDLSADILLGSDFLKDYKINIDIRRGIAQLIPEK